MLNVSLNDDLNEFLSISKIFSNAKIFSTNIVIFVDEKIFVNDFENDNDEFEKNFFKNNNEKIQSKNHQKENKWNSKIFYNSFEIDVHQNQRNLSNIDDSKKTFYQNQRNLSNIDDSKKTFYQNNMNMNFHNSIVSKMNQKNDEKNTNMFENDENFYIACIFIESNID